MGLRTVTNIGDPLVNPSNVVAPFTKVTFRLKLIMRMMLLVLFTCKMHILLLYLLLFIMGM